MLPPQSGLSFDQAPPISVPLRFFLTAPLFLLAAAVLLAWLGPDALQSRHAPATLALTHLLTLGVVSMTMCGALMQMLPVLAGSPITHPLRVAALSHGLLTLGVPVLVFALLASSATLGFIAIALLAGGFGTIVLATGGSLLRARSRNSTVMAMGFSLAALVVTVALGMTLLLARGGDWHVDYSLLAILHPYWGLLGWVALLVIGVAYQVVPMFQITPGYPGFVTRWLTGVLFMLLLAKSVSRILSLPATLDMVIDLSLAAGFVVFAGMTLYLQFRRKRRHADPTLRYWRFGMGALIVAATGGAVFASIEAGETPGLVLGVVFIGGFVMAVISGMLYKIVPFLVWFHLQSRFVRQVAIPNMKMLIPDAQAENQMRVWFCAAGALVLAAIFPKIMTYPAAALTAMAALWLEWNLLRAVRGYRDTCRLAMTG